MPRTLGTSCTKPLHHEVPEGPKKTVGVILENPWVEVLIVLLIVTDVFLVAIELGIDQYWLCISGQTVGASPETIAAAYPEPTAPPEGHHHVLLAASSAWSILAPATPIAEIAATFMRPILPLALADLPAQLPAFLSWTDDQHPVHDPHAAPAAPLHPHAVPADPHHNPHGHVAPHGHGGAPHGGHHHAPGALVCEDKHGHNAHHIMHTCHSLSVIILLIFLAELMLKFWISPTEFLACKLHLLDLVVVAVSLIMDVYISYLVAEAATDGVNANEDFHIIALLVILRTWRVVRIVHGFSEIKNMSEEKSEKEKEEAIREIEEQKEDQIFRLERKVTSLGADLQDEEGRIEARVRSPSPPPF